MQRQIKSKYVLTKNIAKKIALPGQIKNGLRGITNVIKPRVVGEAHQRLWALQWFDWGRERFRLKGKDECMQMIMMTEIKKALAIQNSILKK